MARFADRPGLRVPAVGVVLGALQVHAGGIGGAGVGFLIGAGLAGAAWVVEGAAFRRGGEAGRAEARRRTVPVLLACLAAVTIVLFVARFSE